MECVLQYAALMVALLVAEVVFVMLVWQRVEEWLRSPAAIAFANMQRELSEHLLPLLEALSRIYPLPTKLNDLIAVSMPLTTIKPKLYSAQCKNCITVVNVTLSIIHQISRNNNFFILLVDIINDFIKNKILHN